MDLTGRGALVTGGSGDLGTAICRALAAAGADVAVGYAGNTERAAETCRLVETLGRRAVAIQLDQAAPASVDPAVDGAAAKLGRLDVLVSGPLPPDPGEFVATQKLADILAELHRRYDLVLLDSPPLLRVGDAMTLSSRADGLVVLTRLNIVKRPMLRELSRMLESVPITKLGFVVTGLQREAGYSGGYAYGYGYGYGDQSSHVSGDGGGGQPGALSSNGRGEPAREEETV